MKTLLCLATIFTAVLVECCFAADIGREEANNRFDKANQAYLAGEFEDAISSYEDLLANGFISPALHYNLGNAYARSDNPGLAILNYQRARSLDWNGSDINANLERIRRQSGVHEADSPIWEKGIRAWSLNAWSVVASLLLLGITAIVWLAALQDRRLQWLTSRRVKLLSMAGSVALLCCITVIALRHGELEQGIVIPETAPLRISPIEGAQSVAGLTEGTYVSMLDNTHDGFRLVEILSGQQGWLKESEVRKIYSDES